jgi:hypothetical protein
MVGKEARKVQRVARLAEEAAEHEARLKERTERAARQSLNAKKKTKPVMFRSSPPQRKRKGGNLKEVQEAAAQAQRYFES